MTQVGMSLMVTHPALPPGPIEGFRFLWAFYVSGYRADRHCQPGFTGRRVEEFCTGHAFSERKVSFDQMDRFPYAYVCGVGAGPKKLRGERNLHMPLKFSQGSVVEMTSYNGYLFRAENAELVGIPDRLPAGWNGITDPEHLGCKNFRFAVGAFGAPPAGT